MTRSKSAELVILVPVLRRPHAVKPLLDAIVCSTPEARVLFLPDPDDSPERQAIESFGAEQLPVDGGYAAKVNAGARATTEPLLLLAADDLRPHPGWLERAKAWLSEAVQVVGLNDLIANRRQQNHATHFLMTRGYAELPTIDGGPGPLHEGYRAWYCDNELIATARHRQAYAYAPEAIVEHKHPMNGTADDDETYQLGRALARQDRRTFFSREQLWT